MGLDRYCLIELEMVLEVIQTNLRKSPVMHGLITELKLTDMKAVAEFLHSK